LPASRRLASLVVRRSPSPRRRPGCAATAARTSATGGVAQCGGLERGGGEHRLALGEVLDRPGDGSRRLAAGVGRWHRGAGGEALRGPRAEVREVDAELLGGRCPDAAERLAVDAVVLGAASLERRLLGVLGALRAGELGEDLATALAEVAAGRLGDAGDADVAAGVDPEVVTQGVELARQLQVIGGGAEGLDPEEGAAGEGAPGAVVGTAGDVEDHEVRVELRVERAAGVVVEAGGGEVGRENELARAVLGLGVALEDREGAVGGGQVGGDDAAVAADEPDERDGLVG
jgi:hypothetical protein